MADVKGYYKALEVNENATQEEINKQFKKLSLKWHPDRWVSGTKEEQKIAEEKYKTISEAHSVLGNEQKRREYDMGGQAQGGGGFNPFGGFGFNPFSGGFWGEQQSQRVEKGDDIEVRISITMEQAFNGGSVEAFVTRKVRCSKCNGTGSEDGKDTTCPHCGGSGFITTTTNRGNMFMQQMSPCPHCHGTGKIITKPCKNCHGTGLENVSKKERIDFPKGILDGMTMQVRGRGCETKSENGVSGDMYVIFNVINDNYFEFGDKLNLIHHEYITLSDALLGVEKDVRTIDGKTIKIKIPECTKDKAQFIQRGLGMPDANNQSRRGDYIVIVDYKYPDKLTNEQKEQIKNIKW